MSVQKIKICGISNLLILEELIALEVNYVGFIFFAKSPRNVSMDLLESFKKIDFKSTRPVCVFVNPEEEEVYKISSYLTDPILQFHGDESEEFCESFGLDYWKAIRVKNKEDLGLIDLFPSASAILLENCLGHTGAQESPLIGIFLKTQMSLPIILFFQVELILKMFIMQLRQILGVSI